MPADPLPHLALTAGEPAGIGPDLCIMIAQQEWPAMLTVVADPALLRARAAQLNRPLTLHDRPRTRQLHRPGHLFLHSVPAAVPALPGKLDPINAAYVLATLQGAVAGCQSGIYDALVTAPVHKGVINDAGTDFSGHTEYLAALTGAPTPVMLLTAHKLRVALLTTHLPLAAVSAAVTPERIAAVVRVLHEGLQQRFAIPAPVITVCGLNPHAGEGGHLGREELDVIQPALAALRTEGLDLRGPVPADTAFTPRALAGVDAVLCMYHDQGLPVLKHAGFGEAVNVTLGLPLVRTSVDHGTALELAGTGRADAGSLAAAVALALELCA